MSQLECRTVTVDTPARIPELLYQIGKLASEYVSLFIDLKMAEHAPSLSSISTLALYLAPLDTSYIIDMRRLHDEILTDYAMHPRSLKDVLESETIWKGLFDCRNAAIPLYDEFGIAMKGVIDIQLLEWVSRPARRSQDTMDFVLELDSCVEEHSALDPCFQSTLESLEVQRLPTAGRSP
jgi:exonuclease 3'-5' domain-containing protein 1